MPENQTNFAAVISNYAPRGLGRARLLSAQLKDVVDKVVIVINDDKNKTVDTWEQDRILYIRRPNTGMNIGAWSEAIPFVLENDISLFLQDECVLVDRQFVQKYKEIFLDQKIGMVGESINLKWCHPWSEIARSGLNYRISLWDGRTISRLEYYLLCMNQWGVAPSENGAHLRALIWAFSKSTLGRIKRFPIGTNKEQCIAAEISVSKIINQMGMEFCQASARPFAYFEHAEWRRDGTSKV